MINIAIFEDEPHHAEHLRKTINKWMKQENTEVICNFFESGEQLTHILAKNCDLFFFDIELTGSSGIKAAKLARSYNEFVPIVFITNHSSYVFEGYEVGAFKFLLKPVREADCFACLERARRYAAAKESQTITLSQNGGLHLIPIHEILYIEAQQHYSNIVTIQKSMRFSSNFSSFLAMLPKGTLVQCHRSFIVNYAHISRMEGGFLTLNPSGTVPYSRTYTKSLLQKLSEMR